MSKLTRNAQRKYPDPLSLTCGRCDGLATAYRNGTYCSACSPAWMLVFLRDTHEPNWIKRPGWTEPAHP